METQQRNCKKSVKLSLYEGQIFEMVEARDRVNSYKIQIANVKSGSFAQKLRKNALKKS